MRNAHTTEAKQDRINTTQSPDTVCVESYLNEEFSHHRSETRQNQHNPESWHSIRWILIRWGIINPQNLNKTESTQPIIITLFVGSYLDEESSHHRWETRQHQHNTGFWHRIRWILFRWGMLTPQKQHKTKSTQPVIITLFVEFF